MARGWESKSVEAQQDDHDRGASTSRKLTPEEAAREAHRRTLLLARARMAADLAAATNPTYRKTLESALRALDDELGTK